MCWLMNSPRTDVRVREAVAGEPRDLDFLDGQLLAGLDPALAGALAGGQQLACGPAGECLDPHRIEHLERGAQVLAGVEAAALAPQPLAIGQLGPRELHAHAGAPQAQTRRAVEVDEGYVWRAHVDGVGHGARYGFRVHGLPARAVGATPRSFATCTRAPSPAP